MAFPVKFVHLGLGKCASTYLQNLWKFDDQYAMSIPVPLARALCERAEMSISDPVKIDFPAVDARQTAVVSSEDLDFGWINGIEGDKATRNLRKLVSASLSASHLTDQILVMVRNPVDWLRSLHEQAIKEGGYLPYKAYIAAQKALALEILDLAFLLECHRGAGRKVVVLSADELRHSRATFWDKYSVSLGVPKPSAKVIDFVDNAEHGGNKSLKDRVPYLAKLNLHSARLGKCFTGLTELAAVHPNEHKNLSAMANQNLIWINRRIAEFASLSELKEVAGDVEDEAEFQNVFVDAEMAGRIEKNFLACLEGEETIDPALVGQYRESLKAKVA